MSYLQLEREASKLAWETLFCVIAPPLVAIYSLVLRPIGSWMGRMWARVRDWSRRHFPLDLDPSIPTVIADWEDEGTVDRMGQDRDFPTLLALIPGASWVWRMRARAKIKAAQDRKRHDGVPAFFDGGEDDFSYPPRHYRSRGPTDPACYDDHGRLV